LRTTIGPVKRCFGAYAPLYAACSDRSKFVLSFKSDAERIVVLAEAVSLLCESLESAAQQQAPDEPTFGRKGMMEVREALGQYAESSSRNAASFAAAASALHCALSHVPGVKSDYTRVALLVDVGHSVNRLVLAAGALLADFSNLQLQSTFTRRRTRVIASLQDLLADLKRQVDTSANLAAPPVVVAVTPGSPLSSSPQTSPRSDVPSSPVVPTLKKFVPPKSPRGTGNKSPRGEDSVAKSPRGELLAKKEPEPKKSPRVSLSKSPRAGDEQAALPVSKSSHVLDVIFDVNKSGSKSPRDDRPAEPTIRPSEPAMRPAVPAFRPNEAVAVAAVAASPERNRLSVANGGSASPKSGGPAKCRGVFKYQAKNDGELSFQRGDEIELESGTDVAAAGVWKGRIAGSDGPFLSFPSKYTVRSKKVEMFNVLTVWFLQKFT
jgi:hypothetical protein